MSGFVAFSFLLPCPFSLGTVIISSLAGTVDFVLCNATCKPACFLGSVHGVCVMLKVFLLLHVFYMKNDGIQY